nr:hypothetical protein [uncultured Chitinophaga sp.]
MKEKLLAILGGIGGGVLSLIQETSTMTHALEAGRILFNGMLGGLGGLLIKELYTLIKKRLKRWKQ